MKDGQGERAILLLAKSAFAAAPHGEMARLAELVAGFEGVTAVRYCFSEQGTPSLRSALLELWAERHSGIVIVPLVLPMEPSFRNWLSKSLRRWQSETPGEWPSIRIATEISRSAYFERLLGALIDEGAQEPAVLPAETPAREGSLVPAQKRRVLVCEGGACNAAGADVLWCHLRNRQKELNLRNRGDGTMTAKATCLGPCSLAPVLQVFPEGTYYGGVNEGAIDRIIEEHLLGGRTVAEFAYEPTGRKQRLRDLQPADQSSG